MKQLTIEHLAAYLPYDVKIAWVLKTANNILTMRNCYKSSLYKNMVGAEFTFDNRFGSCGKNMVGDGVFGINKIYLILRPLSQLTEPITHNGETFVPVDVLSIMGYRIAKITMEGVGTQSLPYWVTQKLLSWHFDIFSLGADNLCVYMNPDGILSK